MVQFSFEGEFQGGNTDLVSDSIALNNGVITKAKFYVNTAALTPDPSNFTIYLSNNGGSTWEEVTNNVLHTFTTSGQDLRYKINATGGSILLIRQTDGTDYPIIVTYEI